MPFILYVPFEFPENGSIRDSLPCNGSICGLPAKIFENPPYYAIEISHIDSERYANIMLKQLEWALHYAAIELRTSVRVRNELQEVHYPSDPIAAAKNFGLLNRETIDAVIDGSRPALYLDGKEVVRFTGQRVSVGFGYPCSQIFTSCDQLFCLDEGVVEPERRVKAALDIYSYAKFEVGGPAARFVVLWTVIEVLSESPSPKQSLLTKTLLTRFKNECDLEIASCREQETERSELKKLRSRLDDFEAESISQRVVRYVTTSLSDDNLSSGHLKKLLRRLNQARGKIVHNGKTEFGAELHELDELVLQLLKFEIRSAFRQNR